MPNDVGDPRFGSAPAVALFSSVRSWNDVTERCFGNMTVHSLAHSFSAGLQRRVWAGLELSLVDSAPAQIQGGQQAANEGGCFLLRNLQGHTRIAQAGHEALLGPGDLTVIYRAEPYQLIFKEPHRMQVLTLPVLDGRSALDAHVARTHAPQEAVLLNAFMAQLATMEAAQTLGAGAELRMALDILALCWPRPSREPDSSALAAWERQLHACVARELGDSELDAQALGRLLGISARYVQLVFARSGTTPAAYIQEQRLLRAAERLRTASTARISAVALEVGFGDVSHFCRCFRRRFACSASDWRRAQ